MQRLTLVRVTREGVARAGALVAVGVVVWGLFAVLGNGADRDERLDEIDNRIVEGQNDVVRPDDLDALADAEDVEALREEIRTAPGVAPPTPTVIVRPSTSTNSTAGPPGPVGKPGIPGPSGPPGPTVTAPPPSSPAPSRSCLLRVPVLDRCVTEDSR